MSESKAPSLIQESGTSEWFARWRSQFERPYDFTKVSDKSAFMDGVMQMAKHLATSSRSARLTASASPAGVTGISIGVMP